MTAERTQTFGNAHVYLRLRFRGIFKFLVDPWQRFEQPIAHRQIVLPQVCLAQSGDKEIAHDLGL